MGNFKSMWIFILILYTIQKYQHSSEKDISNPHAVWHDPLHCGSYPIFSRIGFACFWVQVQQKMSNIIKLHHSEYLVPICFEFFPSDIKLLEMPWGYESYCESMRRFVRGFNGFSLHTEYNIQSQVYWICATEEKQLKA